MDRLSGHRALDLATRAVPILKHLTVTGKTMTLKEFGQALGIVTQAWKPGHHQQIAAVLSILQTAFARLEEPPLDLDRIIYTDQQDGHWYRKQRIDSRSTH
jgi:hypothetical protein